jgi:phage terminase Nu1 subunit (DNA packaging protein)
MQEKEATFKELCECYVNSQQLANMLGLTVRHVNRLAQEGVLLRHSNGQFNLVTNIKLYLAHLKR